MSDTSCSGSVNPDEGGNPDLIKTAETELQEETFFKLIAENIKEGIDIADLLETEEVEWSDFVNEATLRSTLSKYSMDEKHTDDTIEGLKKLLKNSLYRQIIRESQQEKLAAKEGDEISLAAGSNKWFEWARATFELKVSVKASQKQDLHYMLEGINQVANAFSAANVAQNLDHATIGAFNDARGSNVEKANSEAVKQRQATARQAKRFTEHVPHDKEKCCFLVPASQISATQQGGLSCFYPQDNGEISVIMVTGKKGWQAREWKEFASTALNSGVENNFNSDSVSTIRATVEAAFNAFKGVIEGSKKEDVGFNLGRKAFDAAQNIFKDGGFKVAFTVPDQDFKGIKFPESTTPEAKDQVKLAVKSNSITTANALKAQNGDFQTIEKNHSNCRGVVRGAVGRQ